MITKDNCRGECCSHTRHLGVCAHQRNCKHHAAEVAERQRITDSRAFITEMSRARQAGVKYRKD